MSASARLKTYLQDHHAGSTAGLELAKRTAGSNGDHPAYGPELAAIASEIEEDRRALEMVMEQLGVGRSLVKDTGGRVAERLGRLKPNDSLFSYSPLSRLIELEGLVIGVTGKLSLWEALRSGVGGRLDGVDLAELCARAVEQRARLEALRERAAVEAFRADAPAPDSG